MPYKEDPPKPVDYVVNALLFVPVILLLFMMWLGEKTVWRSR